MGRSSPQVDVLVLSPAYPPALLNRKQYLASGVIAAFECKLTLRPHHILKVMENATSLRRNLFVRTGTPFRDLFSPLIYGLLAHSHTWTAPTSDPVTNVARALLEADNKLVLHPREMLDVFCVADLATWRVMKVGPSFPPPTLLPEQFSMLGANVHTAYVGPTGHPDQWGPPLGSLFTNLLRRIAWEDSNLRAMADYWRWTSGVSGSWGSADGRNWNPDDVYHSRVRDELPEHNYPTIDEWDEWGHFLF